MIPRIARLFLAVTVATACAATIEAAPYPCEDGWIEVIFVEESRVRLRGAMLVDESGGNATAGLDATLAASAGHVWHRICHVPEARLDEMQSRGEALTGKPVFNLNNMYRIDIGRGSDPWVIAERLEALSGVLRAYPVPLPQALPFPPPDYRGQQGYARPATMTPTGIDSDYSWIFPGGDGSGVTICDLEFAWNYNHGDITKALGSQINTGIADPIGDIEHGTAVIGELVADNNTFGITGLSHGANLLTCGTYFGSPSPQWNVPGAIAVAGANLAPGDVILLEQQWDYQDPGTPGPDFIPIEWWGNVHPNAQTANGVWFAILNAVANGMHVVEAGGNGSVNTDALSWFTGPPWYSPSGAIVVGAGGAYAGGGWPQGDLERLSFSSYGSRFDLQGWGEDVFTTGYGWFYALDGPNYWYTSTFNGTSSAAPIVASAIANCAGYWTAQGRTATTFTPGDMRNVLVNTGTPQVNQVTGWIGPRPDLYTAFGVLHTAWIEGPIGPVSDPGSNSGVSWVDYDSDGDYDLYLSNSDSSVPWKSVNRLLRNDGDWNFVDVTGGPLADSSWSVGSVWGDYDNDGDPDAFIANDGTNPRVSRLVRNDGGAGFTDVTTSAMDWRRTDAAWGDYDRDGDLDLYVVGGAYYDNHLFRNDGASGFTDVTSGPLAGAGYTIATAWADYDGDGDLDLYLGIGAPGTSNQLLRNDGGGTFTDAATGPLASTAITPVFAWGDYDNDGDLDLFLGHYAGYADQLLRNDGAGTFTDVTPSLLASIWETRSAAWGDYDNDSDLDLYVTHYGGSLGDVNHLYQNAGNGTFIEATMSPIHGVDLNAAPATWADYDRDGDLDLYVGHGRGANSIFRSDNTHGHNWLRVRLVGTSSSRDGIGAWVRVVTGTISQVREISGGGSRVQAPLAAHFGLANATSIDTIEVRWPSGTVEVRTPSGGPLSGGIVVNSEIVWLEGTGPVTTGASPATMAASPTRLHPNVPNPFNPVTAIRYTLAAEGEIRISVFDVAGRLVRTLLDEPAHRAGYHEIRWEGRTDAGVEAASGVYFLLLESGDVRASRRMVLMK